MNLTQALKELEATIIKATMKHPGNRWLWEALMEELGEMATTDDPFAQGSEEALHVACVAMRIYMGGTTPMPLYNNTTYTATFLLQLSHMGVVAKQKLDAAGVPK